MSDEFSFLEGLGTKSTDFWNELKDIGVELKNVYVVEEYTGRNFELDYALIHNKGWFSKETIIASNDKADLEDIKSFIEYFPQFHKLTVVSERTAVMKGSFKLSHVSKMHGTANNALRIKQIVKKWKGNDSSIDYILNGIETTQVGFLPISNPKIASAYAELINAGANHECSDEETARMRAIITDLYKNQS